MNKARKTKLIFIGILVAANFILWSVFFSIDSGNDLKVTFFDVGQGDSLLIETPNRGKIIIDGGPDKSVLAKLGRHSSFYDRAVDILIITHPDSDHLAGAVEVAKNYDIGLILVNGKKCATKICAEFDKIVEEKKIKVIAAQTGQKFDFGNNIKMDIFMPNIALAASGKDEDNNFSIISRLVYGADSFLFMGDAEDKEEIDLINAWPDLTAEVLKVGHHGSKNSSNQLFLEKIKPKFSVISVGAKNRYGHPTSEVLEKLEALGAKILRTDLSGDIRIKSDGAGVVLAN
ncbi:MAG: ComEC/Rec2 family competence protein [bacterium]|nr:ComEC/Rec2 family competence protein [bacterium]